MESDSRVESIRWLANEYRDLNATCIKVLEAPPSALEFSRIVHISRPVIIKGGCNNIPTSALWSDDYLVDKMSDRKISIAVTPNGRADAVTRGSDGKLYFVEPHVDRMSMGEFLNRISTTAASTTSEISYLQSQNGNLYSADFFNDTNGEPDDAPSELQPLRQDVPSEIKWCSEALGRTPDAVNIWIGNSKSVTSIHSDPYENIYAVVRGAKHFTLLPPTEAWCLKERSYPHATYTRTSSSALALTPSSPDVPPVRWSSIPNPHLPDALPREVHPIHITVLPGEMLYLPVGWWHHVRQSEDLTIALNWWYDAEMQGLSWVVTSFLRGLGDVPPGNCDDDNSEIYS